MIDRQLLRTLCWAGSGLWVLSAGAALAIWASLPLAGGLLLGFALGALPFLTWAWIASRGFATSRARLLTVVLLAGKLAVYSGALYVFVTREVVDPVGVMAGLTEVVLLVAVGAAIRTYAPPREAAR